MTIDEAIKHAREVAEENRKQEALKNQCDLFFQAKKCRRCAEEHEQIAEWLEELKKLRRLKESVLKDYEDDIANAKQNIESMKYEMYLAGQLNR